VNSELNKDIGISSISAPFKPPNGLPEFSVLAVGNCDVVRRAACVSASECSVEPEERFPGIPFHTVIPAQNDPEIVLRPS
jgi:hypothetical protein